MNDDLGQGTRLRAHLVAHVTPHLTRGGGEPEGREIFLVALGNGVEDICDALNALDELNGRHVRHTNEYAKANDQITVLYVSAHKEWKSHTWWDPNLTDTQLEIYTQLRADGMPIEQARLCALELGAVK